MIRSVLTIARRDYGATVLTKGFIVWLVMPLVAMLIGPLFGFLVGSSFARPEASGIALIDAENRLRPHLENAAADARTVAVYGGLRDRFGDLRPGAALPADLALPPDALPRATLERFRADGALEALQARYDLTMPFGAGLPRAERVPRFVTVDAAPDTDAQARRLLRADDDGEKARFAAVLLVDARGERLMLGRGSVDTDVLARLVNDARALRSGAATVDAARAARGPLVTEVVVARSSDTERIGRSLVANAAVFVLFMLIAVLAQVLLSNMVEEKSNKIIEVLTASVAVPAIFAGKLIGMLGIALTGLAVWGGAAAVLAGFVVPTLPAGLLPTPALGWAGLLAFGFVYFTTAYLIFGAVYLGIGSLCSSIREVQSLSLPATIVTTATLFLTLAGIGNPDGGAAAFASWFPFSSPFMMLGRAAFDDALWPHVAAVLWQLGFAAFTIFWSARLFRRGVLSSGPAPSLFGGLFARRQKSSLS
jgi:ABC-2 type transport system permease protein